MVGGFNTNIRYQGRTFHVQTEDSGPQTPKIVTLLYEGGSILFSRKTSYDPGNAPADPSRVRALMEKQHKEMVEALKDGRLDAEIAGGTGPANSDETEREGSRAGEPPDTSRVVAEKERREDPPSRPSVTAPTAIPKPILQTPAARSQAAGRTTGPSSIRSFGQGVITQKPLDEVVLALLAAK